MEALPARLDRLVLPGLRDPLGHKDPLELPEPPDLPAQRVQLVPPGLLDRPALLGLLVRLVQRV